MTRRFYSERLNPASAKVKIVAPSIYGYRSYPLIPEDRGFLRAKRTRLQLPLTLIVDELSFNACVVVKTDLRSCHHTTIVLESLSTPHPVSINYKHTTLCWWDWLAYTTCAALGCQLRWWTSQSESIWCIWIGYLWCITVVNGEIERSPTCNRQER